VYYSYPDFSAAICFSRSRFLHMLAKIQMLPPRNSSSHEQHALLRRIRRIAYPANLRISQTTAADVRCQQSFRPSE
jgi:hypothetical protein